MTIDCGFSHMLAQEVLKDTPDNIEAKNILNKPKYRIGNQYFETREEFEKHLNSERKNLVKNL